MALNDFSQAANAAPRNLMIQAQHIKPKLTPKVDKQPVKIVVPEMNIEAIPTAMRRMGWTVSAALMERWFASPEWTMPLAWKDRAIGPGKALQINSSFFDDQIVTMKWALEFPRCQRTLAQLKTKLDNPAAVHMLNIRLDQHHWNRIKPFKLGHETWSARTVDDLCQMNFLPFGDPTDPLDDMFGALGSATLKAGLIGEATKDPKTGGTYFQAKKAGFYIKDFYDFNGDQFLGTWTENGILSKPLMLANAIADATIYSWRGERIGNARNASFRDFRDTNKRGGDFMIFSDVHWVDFDRRIDLGPPL
jgi:hypothetical protein